MTSPVSCAGDADGTATAFVEGAVNYGWTGPGGFAVSGAGMGTVENLVPGAYTVTVTGAGGCVGVGSALVEEPLPLTVEPFRGSSVVSWRCKWHRGGRPSRRNRTHRGVLELAGGEQRDRAVFEWRRGGRLHVFRGGRKWLHGVGHPHIGRPVSLGGDRDGDFAQLRRRAKCP